MDLILEGIYHYFRPTPKHPKQIYVYPKAYHNPLHGIPSYILKPGTERSQRVYFRGRPDDYKQINKGVKGRHMTEHPEYIEHHKKIRDTAFFNIDGRVSQLSLDHTYPRRARHRPFYGQGLTINSNTKELQRDERYSQILNTRV